ncbi:hypothetical protein VTO42DRAFT_8696 [Malbranchea cinnamomea]
MSTYRSALFTLQQVLRYEGRSLGFALPLRHSPTTTTTATTTPTIPTTPTPSRIPRGSILEIRRYHSVPRSAEAAQMDPEPAFSEGSDRQQLMGEVQELLQNGWQLDAERMGLSKLYYFKTYTKCLDFSQVVGIRSKSKNHHSTMTIKSGSVHIHWTTHFPRGLSGKDTAMARYCDEQARLIGTVERSEAQKCGPSPASQTQQ